MSGGEEAVRAILAGYARDKVDSLEVDPMGSLVAHLSPASSARRKGPHVMLCAHMDEVGLMVTAIGKEGRLCFRRVGELSRILHEDARSHEHGFGPELHDERLDAVHQRSA